MNTQEQIAKIIQSNLGVLEWDTMTEDVKKQLLDTATQIIQALAATPDEALREEIADIVHVWHCPDEAGIDEVYWTGIPKQDYLECSDQILSLIQPILSARVEQAKQAGRQEVINGVKRIAEANPDMPFKWIGNNLLWRKLLEG